MLLGILPGCFSSNENMAIKYTYFIQLLSDSKALVAIKQDITPVINTIIKEELGLKKEYDFEFFLPKKPSPQYLTLYYLYDMPVAGESFLITALESIENKLQKLTAQHASIAPKVAFFGDNKDELVILVHDSKKELSALNSLMKNTAHESNEEYKQKQHVDLYDITKSEKYTYLPHIGLGRIRASSIRQQLKDETQTDKVFEKIRERIIKEVLGIIEKTLSPDSAKLHFNKLRVWNLQKNAEAQIMTLSE